MGYRREYSNVNLLLGFLAGGAIGVGLALLFAPRSGKETRRKIREFAGDTSDKVVEYAGDVKEKVTSTIGKSKDFIDEKKSALSTAIESGKEAYKEEKQIFSS